MVHRGFLVPDRKKIGKIRGGDPVLIRKNPAAHAVEQDVGEVMCPGCGPGRQLQTVRGGDIAGEVFARLLQGAFHRPRRPALNRNGLAQGGDLSVVQSGVAGKMPARRFLGRQRQTRTHQVVAARPVEHRLRGQDLAVAELRQAIKGQMHAEIVQSATPDSVGPEHLQGLSPVGDAGGQGINTQARFLVDFGFLVGIDQVACLLVKLQRRSPGQDVPQPVQQSHLHGLAIQVGEGGGPHPAEWIAGRPAVPEQQTEPVVDFFEGDAVAGDILGEVAFDIAVEVARGREGLPEHRGLIFAFEAHQAHRSGVVVGIVELIHRQVGKKAALRVDPAGGQTPTAGDKHPQVRIAGDTDQKGIQAVIGGNPVLDFPVPINEPAAGRARADPTGDRPGVAFLLALHAHARLASRNKLGSSAARSSR